MKQAFQTSQTKSGCTKELFRIQAMRKMEQEQFKPHKGKRAKQSKNTPSFDLFALAPFFAWPKCEKKPDLVPQVQERLPCRLCGGGQK